MVQDSLLLIKSIIGTVGEPLNNTYSLDTISYQSGYPDFENYIKIILENVLVLRKFTVKYLEVNGKDVCNFFPNCSEKKNVCGEGKKGGGEDREAERERK